MDNYSSAGVSIIDKVETQNPFIRQFGKKTF